MREEELVKCRVLPDDIGVQHGVLCSGVWWGLRPCFGRGYRVFEEDGLGPYPPAVCGRRDSVFSFDGSTVTFFLGRQKESGGGKPSIFIDAPLPARWAGQSLSHGGAVTAPVVVPKILCSLNAHRI